MSSSIPTVSPFSLPLNPLGSSSSVQEVKEKPSSVQDKFLELAKMTPAERMRASILSSMGITEEQLASMPPEQRKAIEQKIADTLKQAAEKEMQKKPSAAGFFADIKA